VSDSQSLWFSPGSRAVAQGDESQVQVSGEGLEAKLSGLFAAEFLSRFQGKSTESPRLEALARMGSKVHQQLLDVARAGDGGPWFPLTARTRQPTLFLELVGRCNERCLHCYAESAPEVTEELSREHAEKILREARALGFEWVQFTGGDPLLCSFLVELVELAKELGFSGREIYTNGLALTEARADALAKLGACFAFSFYSANPARHDAITRVPGSQQRTLQAIERAIKRGCDVRAGVVDFGDGAPALEATLKILTDLGVPRSTINVDIVRTVGRGVPTPVSSSDQIPIGTRHTGSDVDDSSIIWPGKLCVSYTGHVYPCIFARSFPLGDSRQESLGSIIQRARDARFPAGLRDAGAKLACYDCRLTAFAMTETPV
jgi:MoaA/NifB/PqqE/SkfB family radical SAM enzyme